MMVRGFGLGQATTPQTPWWCGVINLFPVSAEQTPSCYPQPQTPPAVGAPAGALTQPNAVPQSSVDQLLKDQRTAWYSQNQGMLNAVPAKPVDMSNPLAALGAAFGIDGGGGGGQPATDLCSKIFGTGIAGVLGRTLCPVVMVVGGVAVIAVVALIFTARR